jgi:hypothetical protein
MDKEQIIRWYADWAVNLSNDPYGEIEWLVSKLDKESFKEIIDVYKMHKSLKSDGEGDNKLPF